MSNWFTRGLGREKKFWGDLFTPEAGKLDILDIGTLGMSELGQRGTSSYLGGKRQDRKAIRDASSSAQEGIDRSTALQEQMYNQNRADMMPWMDFGKKRLGVMGERFDSGYYDMPTEDLEGPAFNFNMQMDPGYQHRMSSALDALKASQSARGNRLSGGSMAGLMDRAQGVASDELSNAYNRQYGQYQDQYQRRGNAYNRRASSLADQYNRDSSSAGVGQQMSSQLANQGQNYGNQMSNLFNQQGQNTSNAIMAQQQLRANDPWAMQNIFTPQNLLQGAGMFAKGGM